MYDNQDFVRGQHKLMREIQEQSQWEAEERADRARIRKAFAEATKKARKTKDKYGQDHNV